MNITQTIFMHKQSPKKSFNWFTSLIEEINLESVHKKFFSKKVILYTIGIPLLVVLKTPVEKFLSKNLVTPILSNIPSEWCFDAFFIAIALCIILLSVLRFRKYTASKEFFVLEILILSAYLYYRLSGTAWTFTPFKLIDSIKYADLLILGVFCQSVLLIPYKRVKPENKPGSLFEDKPLGEKGKDILGYNSYAKLLGNKILDSHFDKSFAVGINGKWGLGKTSFIDLLKRTVQGNDIIEIDFNPWNSQSPQAIIQDFFTSFNEKVRPYHSSIIRLSNEYATKLVQLKSNTFTRSIQLIASSLTNNKPTNSLYKQINTALEKINKKVVIYIDDLDRLDSYEIVEVLRLIRNTANFYNTIFVVAYDRNYIVNSLNKHTSFGEIEFLEKIFQIEVTLPNFNKSILRNELAEKLKKNFPKANLETISQTIIGSATSKPLLLDSWLETLRDVTRLANSITINYSKLVGEVIFSEFLLIELLRLKYPSIYELLKWNNSKFLYNNSDQRLQKSNFILITKDLKSDVNELKKSDQPTLEEYLVNAPHKHSIHKNDIPKVIGLISSLFPKEIHFAFSNKEPLSIIRASQYNRYFRYDLPDGNLSEVEFSNARRLNTDQFLDKITEWVKLGLATELERQFYDINTFDNKEDFEKIIRAIFHLANQPTKESKFVGFDGHNLLYKLNNHEKNSLAKKYYPKEDGENQLKAFVRDLFDQAKSPYSFEANILILMNEQTAEMYPISREDRGQILIQYFKNYCDEISEWNQQIWTLFHYSKKVEWIQVGESSSYDRHEEFTKEGKDIMKAFALNKDLDGFLQAIIIQNRFDIETYNLSSMVEVIFDTWKNFEIELIKKDESQYKNLEEFNQFYKLYAKFNHSQSIAFEFKNIKVND